MEVLLRAGEKSCVIHKCYPGSNHYIRIHAISNDSTILDRSKQLVVQTSAPPDTPNVTLRCVCLHRYQQSRNREGIPAIPHFCENVPFFRYISKTKKIVIIFHATEIFCAQKLCRNSNDWLRYLHRPWFALKPRHFHLPHFASVYSAANEYQHCCEGTCDGLVSSPGVSV